MLRFLVSQLRFGRGRAFALGLGVLVAAVAFTVLTAATRTSQLRVHGTVRRTYRTAYDVLVRPRGSLSSFELRRGLVRDNSLSGASGGITLEQYHRIAGLPGVAVAAPVENLGYVFPFELVRQDLAGLLTREPFQLYRIRQAYVANGVSHYPGDTLYVYYTRRDRFAIEGRDREFGEVGPLSPAFTRSCDGFVGSLPPHPDGPFDTRFGEIMYCFSGRTGVNSINLGFPRGPPRGFVGAESAAYFPIAVAAIDPVAEARLLGLRRTLVSGRYFRSGEGVAHSGGVLVAPLLAASRSYVGEDLQVTIERLRVPAGTDVPRALASGACLSTLVPCPAEEPAPAGAGYKNARGFLEGLPGRVVQRRALGLAAFYRRLLAEPRFDSPGFWATSPTSYRTVAPDELAPKVTRNPVSVWFAQAYGYVRPPRDNLDVQFRRLHEREGIGQVGPAFHVIGRFDPARLPGFSPLSRVPLETYYPPVLEAADAAARRVLGHRPFLPSQNLGGYVQQPPLLLTTLDAAAKFFDPSLWSGVPPRERRAPISVIRLRVRGVTGPNALSEQRIRLVAERIHEATGLQVDITAGSSPHPLKIDLAAGRFGRPALLLEEGWSKKGVALVFLQAVDRKSLGLFALVLLVCAFSLANGAVAAVRTRRGELGTLATLGWSRGELFRTVLVELAAVGLSAGLLGTGIAVALARGLALDFPLLDALYVLPLAVALTALAGLVPAWRAGRLEPLDAIRPPVQPRSSAWRASSLSRMAFLELTRLPLRTALGGAGLLVGVAALTVLVGLQEAFRGTLVGTVLGQAITVQVRGVDFVAIGLTVALAALSVADVLYLNLRERQAELVTLKTLGWSEREVRALVGLEALALGLLGSLLGVAAGLAIGGPLLGVSVGPLAVGAGIACAGGTLAALAASRFPLAQIGRLSAPTVLAAE